MCVYNSTNPCRCCGHDYVWDEREFLVEPGVCDICDGRECQYCGKYVSHAEDKGDSPIHSGCEMELLKEF